VLAEALDRQGARELAWESAWDLRPRSLGGESLKNTRGVSFWSLKALEWGLERAGFKRGVFSSGKPVSRLRESWSVRSGSDE